MCIENVQYMRTMASELAALAEGNKLDTLAFLFRMAEEEAKEMIGDGDAQGNKPVHVFEHGRKVIKK
jgi:hypothetical protein